MGSVQAADDKLLYLYNWLEYLPESVIEQFQTDVGEAITVYEKYWDALKAGRN